MWIDETINLYGFWVFFYFLGNYCPKNSQKIGINTYKPGKE
jgi:hypothetical protein